MLRSFWGSDIGLISRIRYMGSSLYRRGVVKKDILCLSALLALSATGALAEEMASPPSAFVTGRQPYLSWTGVYAGINGGYTWSNPNVSYVANDAASIAGTCAVPGGLKCIPTADFKRDGGLFGGQVGFNWQFNTLWLAGVEVTDDVLERLRGMDDPSMVDQLYEIGRRAAEKQVKPEHLFA